MRALSAAELTAIQQDLVVARDFVWLTCKDRDTGDPQTFGWWTDLGTVSVTVEDGISGSEEERVFVGGGALLNISSIPLVTDLSVRPVEVELSILDETVESALRTYDPRNGAIQIYRGYQDPATQTLVAPAKARFVGTVDEAPIETAEEGRESVATLICVGRIRELTRTNPSVRSHEDQVLRDETDNFFEDNDVVGQWEIHWGGSSSTPEKQGKRFAPLSQPLLGPVVIA